MIPTENKIQDEDLGRMEESEKNRRYKIRIRFRKWGVMKFIGHLDMMRYFQKAIRRAGIDICFSEGFSPHPVMSFAAPLGVGITSEGEYFDIEVHSTESGARSIAALNAVMVDGVEITGYVKLPPKTKTAMAAVAAADYALTFMDGCDPVLPLSQWQELIREHFVSAPEFIITKKTKKSERQLDLKPLVYECRATTHSNIFSGRAFDPYEETEADRISFFLSVSTGSMDNIKPELVISSLCRKAGITDVADRLWIHRLETYSTDESGKNRIPLLAQGEEIGERDCI